MRFKGEYGMKSRFLFPVLVLAFAACSTLEEIPTPTPPSEDEAEEADVVEPSDEPSFILTVKASKGEPETKALDLSGDGHTLNAYWTSTETVRVYKAGALVGSLNVAPDAGEKPVTATLSGPVIITGIAPGDGLTLMIPRQNWDYSGQDGTIAGIGSSFSYALASVTVDTVDNQNYTVSTTSGATFENQQSVYRLGFKDGGDYIDPNTIVISAANGGLVQSVSWSGSAWTPAFGEVNVTAASAPADHFYYVALRNDNTVEDTYGFLITTFDSKLYMATKVIPASVLDVTGKFISAKSISAVQPSFTTAEGTADTAL